MLEKWTKENSVHIRRRKKNWHNHFFFFWYRKNVLNKNSASQIKFRLIYNFESTEQTQKNLSRFGSNMSNGKIEHDAGLEQQVMYNLLLSIIIFYRLILDVQMSLATMCASISFDWCCVVASVHRDRKIFAICNAFRRNSAFFFYFFCSRFMSMVSACRTWCGFYVCVCVCLHVCVCVEHMKIRYNFMCMWVLWTEPFAMLILNVLRKTRCVFLCGLAFVVYTYV